jgi:hypothetical protein
MSRYRSIRVVTTGEGAMSDDEARAMFGLPPREEADEDMASFIGLSSVPSGDGDGEVAVPEEATSAAE